MHLTSLSGAVQNKINNLLYLFAVGLAEMGFVSCLTLMWLEGRKKKWSSHYHYLGFTKFLIFFMCCSLFTFHPEDRFGCLKCCESLFFFFLVLCCTNSYLIKHPRLILRFLLISQRKTIVFGAKMESKSK